MKKLILAFGLCLLASAASAQCNGVFPANTVCGNSTGSPAPPSAVSFGGTIVGPGTTVVNDFVQWNNITGTSIKDPGFTTGTTGHAIPFLDGINVWSGAATFPSVGLKGSGSGTISILPQAAAGTYNFNLPTTAGTAGQFLSSAGGAGAPMTWTTPAPTAQAGVVTVYYNGSAWVAQKPDGTFVSTGSTTTCAVQEAANYAAPLGYSMIFYGQGTANPCTVGATTTITFPAAYSVSYYFYGADFIFANGGQHGFYLDTQRYGRFVYSGVIHYVGTAGAVAIRPTLGPAGISCTANATACWFLDYKIDLDTIFIEPGATADACLFIDVGAANGASQLLSSTVANNIITLNACEGQQHSQYGIHYVSPTNAFQAGGENQITFGNVEGATVAQINIGGSSVNDSAIGTNHWIGNVASTGNTASQTGITTDSSGDVFDLASLNCYQSVGSQVNILWETNAGGNVIHTPQMIACGAGTITDSSTVKTNNVYLSPSPLPLPRAVAGLPTCAPALEGWQYVVTNNATGAAWNGAVTGGGALVSTVKCDGSSWKQF